MLLFGRLSSRIVESLANVTGAVPALATVNVQVQEFPSVVVWPTLSARVSVRSGAVTVTVSGAAVLLVLLCPHTQPSGSTRATPPARGLTKGPPVAGVAVTTTSKLPPGAMVAPSPAPTVTVRSPAVTADTRLAALLTPLALAMLPE